MPNEIKGYYRVWRRARKHVLWNMKPYDPWHAWEYLFGWAAFSRQERAFMEKIFILERGQHVTTKNQLAKDWGWSWSRVHGYLTKLEKLGMTRSEDREGCIIVTICNYEVWQGKRSGAGKATGKQPGSDRETTGNDRRSNQEEKKEERGAALGAAPAQTGQPDLLNVDSLSPEACRGALEASERTKIRFSPETEDKLRRKAALTA
jgi:hypothetical protein